jgi:hypothetical protein
MRSRIARASMWVRFFSACAFLCLGGLTSACADTSETATLSSLTALPSPSSAPPLEDGVWEATPIAAVPAEAPTSAPTSAAITTPTPSATLVPTPDFLTPLPTIAISDQQRRENIATLMHPNPTCDLPCWWGIVPGTSQASEVAQSLTAKGFWATASYAHVYIGYNIYLDFVTNADAISSLTVSSSLYEGDDRRVYVENWQRYWPEAILDRYGLPQRVYLYHPFQFDSGGGPGFHLLLAYEDRGFVIEYWGNAEYLGDARYRACFVPEQIFDFTLHLFQPGTNGNTSLETILPPLSVSHIAGPDEVYDLISWKGATGMDLEALAELFSGGPATGCAEFTSQ